MRFFYFPINQLYSNCIQDVHRFEWTIRMVPTRKWFEALGLKPSFWALDRNLAGKWVNIQWAKLHKFTLYMHVLYLTSPVVVTCSSESPIRQRNFSHEITMWASCRLVFKSFNQENAPHSGHFESAPTWTSIHLLFVQEKRQVLLLDNNKEWHKYLFVINIHKIIQTITSCSILYIGYESNIKAIISNKIIQTLN